MDGNGILSNSYTLPSATATILGGVKIGSGLTVAGDGLVSVGPSFQVDYIDFNTAATTPAHNTGRMHWNAVDQTMDLDLDGGSILQLGQELLVRALNNTGATILNGKAVYVTGAQGNRPTIALASASADLSSRVVGVATQDVANNAIGFFTVKGLVHDLDTSAFAEGADIWLSTTAGGFVTSRPVAPNAAVYIGTVVRSHATVGQIFVNVNRGFKLGELGNVSITNPQNSQVLTYTDGVWGNTAAPVAANMVTTDTAQTITGAKAFAAPITSSRNINVDAVQSQISSLPIPYAAIKASITADTGSAASFLNAFHLTYAVNSAGGGGRAQTGAFIYSYNGTIASDSYFASFMSAHLAANVATTTVNAPTYGFRTTLGDSASNVLNLPQPYYDFAAVDEGLPNSVIMASRYGIYLKKSNFAPTSAYYGVWIDDMPSGTPTAYAIYSGNGNVRLGGGVELSSFTPSTTTDRLYNVSGTLHWNGAAVQTKTTVDSSAPSANVSMTNAWINRYSKMSPTTTINVVVEPGIATVGDKITVAQGNTTLFTLTAGSGVTLNCATAQASITPRAQHSVLNLICVASNVFDVYGDFTP